MYEEDTTVKVGTVFEDLVDKLDQVTGQEGIKFEIALDTADRYLIAGAAGVIALSILSTQFATKKRK